MLPNPPPGWEKLQKKAREAKDAKELSTIIDEMNRLLSTLEKSAGLEDAEEESTSKDDPDRPGNHDEPGKR
jgi:hypothetical protein